MSSLMNTKISMKFNFSYGSSDSKMRSVTIVGDQRQRLHPKNAIHLKNCFPY